MKRAFSLLLVLCLLVSLLLGLSLPAAAQGRMGYDPAKLDSSCGTRVCDFEYTYWKNSKESSYRPYYSRYLGDPQCVGYVYARIEEKLNMDGIGFVSGDGAKDIIGNAAKVDGKEVHSAGNAEQYIIRVHRNDGGAYLAANSFACFDGWGAAGARTRYGHVIYVEEVRSVGGTRYVYYTEGSSGYHDAGTDGILKKLSVSDFIGGRASSGAYMGCVVFEPKCEHSSCDDRGICKECGQYFPSRDRKSSYTAFPLARTYVTVDASPFRSGPYMECAAPSGDTPAGTEVSIVGKLTNSYGNIWYKTSDGTYVYESHLRFVREGVYMTDLSFTNLSETGVRMNAKVHKPKNTVSELFGIQVLDLSLFPLSFGWSGSQVFWTADPNGKATEKNTSFDLYVDLLEETNLRLISGHRYRLRLFVKVNGDLYYSDSGEVVAGDSGSLGDSVFLAVADPDEEPAAPLPPLSPAPTPTPEPTPTPTPASGAAAVLTSTDDPAYLAKAFVAETNACVVTKIVKRSGSRITRSGVALYDAAGALIKDYWHSVSNVRDTTTTFHSWYDLREEVGVTLAPGTTYQYRFHVTVDGVDYYGEYYRFTTKGGAATPTPEPTPEPASVPANAWISADRSLVSVGAGITLRYGADHAAYYALLVDREGGGRYATLPADGTDSQTVAIPDAGVYTVTLRAYNADGSESLSAPLRLEVIPALGEVTLRMNKTTVMPDEQFVITFDAAGAVLFQLDVYQGSTLVFQEALENGGSWAAHVSEPGDYTLIVVAFDRLGGTEVSPPVRFIALENAASFELHFPRSRSYRSGQFSDVRPSDWFETGVRTAYELGLMQGVSGDCFEPTGRVTLAQALTMAARIHSIYHTGEEHFVQSGSVWYQVYLDYALQHGLLPQVLVNEDMNCDVTRGVFAMILAAALDADGLPPINDIPDGAIPDLERYDPWYFDVYRLYRAGILTGSDSAGTFFGSSSITRAEAAAIVSRIADSDARRTFSLS